MIAIFFVCAYGTPTFSLIHFFNYDIYILVFPFTSY